MKAIINFFILSLFICTQCFGDGRNIQDNYKFVYSIVDSLGVHVSGQTVALKIQRASDGYFYDFFDSTFKSSSWTNKTINLSEDTSNGIYYYTFDPPASETGAQQYVFIVDNSDSTYGDHQAQVVSYQNIGTSIFNSAANQVTIAVNNDKTGYRLSTTGVGDVWNEAQSGHTTSGTFGKYLDTQISAISSLSAATVADAVWNTDISSGYTGKAGETVRRIDQDTNGIRDGTDYNGVEKMIRVQR